jgi:O-acetyl-ADP-ribose deacetylase (regulator of RNase III)
MAKIAYTHGNILEADTGAVVNTVNCVGVMGKGIALQFKQAYPDNFKEYLAACRRKLVKPGTMLIHRTGRLNNPKYVVNFPTKRHWKGKSKVADIKAGLNALRTEIERLGIESIAIPALGCGNGGLDWNDVRPLIEEALNGLNVDAIVFPPQHAPEPERQLVGTSKPHLTHVRASLILLLKRYQIEGYRHSLLEIQKLAYFLQAAGESLKLKFVKDKYGPYAENLNFALQKLEGHYIRGYGDRSRAAEIQLLPAAIDDAEKALGDDSATRQRLQRVVRLIEGYESPYGLELLSTVHWIMHEMPIAAIDDKVALAGVLQWNARKVKLFKERHIEAAWHRLKAFEWSDPSVASPE